MKVVILGYQLLQVYGNRFLERFCGNSSRVTELVEKCFDHEIRVEGEETNQNQLWQVSIVSSYGRIGLGTCMFHDRTSVGLAKKLVKLNPSVAGSPWVLMSCVHPDTRVFLWATHGDHEQRASRSSIDHGLHSCCLFLSNPKFSY